MVRYCHSGPPIDSVHDFLFSPIFYFDGFCHSKINFIFPKNCVGLAKSLDFFHKVVWKTPKELFGQCNICIQVWNQLLLKGLHSNRLATSPSPRKASALASLNRFLELTHFLVIRCLCLTD